MAKIIILISRVICIIGGSIAHADLFLTIDGENPTGIPLMLSGTGPYTIVLDGNTPIGPNDVRFEVITGTLTAIPDTNHQYTFQYEGESTTGLIRLITNIDMTIDGYFAPAGMTIYELFVFCNPEFEFTGACGSDITVFIPPEGEEGGQDESLMEEQKEQSVIKSEGKSFTEELTDFLYTEASYDPTMDLNYDGIIDFLDFAILGDYWITIYDIYDLDTMCSVWATMDCCVDINNIPNPADNNNWEIVIFSGIGDCPRECWDEEFSDLYRDNCGRSLQNTCLFTPDYGYYCAFNYWWYGLRVGLCVYKCGRNDFQVLRNTGGCRFIFARHRTRDIPQYDPECLEYPWYPWGCPSECDEGTTDYYNWQVVVTYLINGVRVGYCRESVTRPSDRWGWQLSEGQEGPCKYHWWPY